MLIQNVLRLVGIDPADRDSRMDNHELADFRFRHTCHVTHTPHSLKLNLRSCEQRFAIQPANDFSRHGQAHVSHSPNEPSKLNRHVATLAKSVGGITENPRSWRAWLPRHQCNRQLTSSESAIIRRNCKG